MATALCTPSRDTESTTYSVPSRNSCTSALSDMCPSPLVTPQISPKACTASSALAHLYTRSEPALLAGFTTTFVPDGTPDMNSRISPSVRQSRCMHARTPLALTASCMWNLWRRASVSARLLPLVPKRALSLSASSTAVSAPGMMAMTGTSSARRPARVASRASSSLALAESCCTVGWWRMLECWDDTSAATGESRSEKSSTTL
mmetsp:Transcript_5843/g.19647  ORF Transcript_5843/g.19647 Transcript_5843/m.19647 type:complete len:204 (-) Transcript_5843:130-741(-)